MTKRRKLVPQFDPNDYKPLHGAAYEKQCKFTPSFVPLSRRQVEHELEAIAQKSEEYLTTYDNGSLASTLRDRSVNTQSRTGRIEEADEKQDSNLVTREHFAKKLLAQNAVKTLKLVVFS